MHAADVRIFPSSSNRLERLGHFLSHYLEMVAVMLLGMVVLGGPLRALLLSGHEDPLMHAPVPAYAVATLPMVAWMRYRGHTWQQAAETSAVMILAVAAPLGIVQLAATAGLGWPTLRSLPPMTHLGLFAMAALMLYHCKDYCRASTARQYCGALFTSLFRARRGRTAGTEYAAGSGLGVVGTLLCWSLVLALVAWGTLMASAYH
jgi:hypothetical protein